MKAVDDKRCYSNTSAQEANGTNFEFHRGNSTNKVSHHRKILGSSSKPTPSKWDDAQKWLAGLSGGGGDHGYLKNKPRNSNAEDRKLLNSASQKARESISSIDLGLEDYVALGISNARDEGETKKMDCSESLWRMSNPVEDLPVEVNSICLRDMGTEMTPIASQEPSRTNTPIRATTPVLTSPIDSRSSSPGRCRQGAQISEGYQTSVRNLERKNEAVGFGKTTGSGWSVRGEGNLDGCKVAQNNGCEQIKSVTSLESRALAWDEAERAKYMARYKREEVKIQAWENHQKRKAELEMKRIEVKADRLKTRAEERLANKVAATRRIAEEKRANAEAKLNERAARTSERADFIRRTGHLPFSFSLSLKLPSFCG